MKFHWADFLDREGGHWQMTPNNERGKYWSPEQDCASFPENTRIATVSRDNTNFDALQGLEHLEELTLHETHQEQIDRLADLPGITRLRITHARPKTLAALASLGNVEELMLEYVSGVEDLAPVGAMPSLRALYIENMRRVVDFSPLGTLNGLKCLQVRGTWDVHQPMQSIAFAADLASLEYLSAWVNLKDVESARALVAIGGHCEFAFPLNFVPLEIFAYLEAHCHKAAFEPIDNFGKLLGKGQRAIPKPSRRDAAKRRAIRQRYADLVEAARTVGS